MYNKLIEINELMDILGYSDTRSVRKFCINNKLPLLNLGMKTYTVSNFLDIVIAKQLSANYPNFDQIINAINQDDKEELAKLVDAPVNETVSGNFNAKKKAGKAAADLLSKLNAA